MSRPAGGPATTAVGPTATPPGADETTILTTVVPARTTDRFAQLTYTSFDRGAGSPGGWQVKERAGAVLEQADERFLVARVTISTEDGPRSLTLPTAAELEARPRKLVYAPGPPAPGPDGRPRVTAAYWHTTSAGQDSSGRPGNVFVHVLLDREPATPLPPLRPSDLILSPRWLRPFGPAVVLAATLAEVPPPPWPDAVIGRPEVVAFLVDEATWRPGLLAALLDAVYAAMATVDAPPVVLAVTDPARGLHWTAAVCHLMSAGTSRRLYFSTYERAAGLAKLAEKGIRFAVLPADDLAALRDSAGMVLIVDGEETVELGDLPHGQAHVTRPYHGEIAVTPYSVVAALALQDPGLAEAVLERQDEIAAAAGDRDLPCGWPLAMAVLEQADDLEDARTEAERLVREAPPPSLPPALAHRVRELLAGSFGRTAADAYDQATALGAGHGAYGFAVNAFYRRVFDDPTFLLEDEPRPSLTPLPPEALDDELVAMACAALDACTARGRRAKGKDQLPPARLALRLTGFALSIGLAEVQDGVTRSLRAAIDAAVENLVERVLLDPDLGPRLVTAVGPLPRAVQDFYVRPWVDARLDAWSRRPDVLPVGRRVPGSVLAWLYPEPPEPPGVHALADRETPVPATLAELAVQVTGIVADPLAFRPLAARVLVESLENGWRERLVGLARGPALSAAEAGALVTAYDALPVVPLLLPTLLDAPYDAALQGVLRRVLSDELKPHRHEDVAVAAVIDAATLRQRAVEWTTGWDAGHGGTGRELLEVVVPFLEFGRSLAPDLADAVISARVVEVVDGAVEAVERPALVRWIATRAAPDGVVSSVVVGMLRRRLRAGLLVDAAVAAQLGSSAALAARAGRPALTELARLQVIVFDVPEPVLDHVIRRAVQDMRPEERAAFARDVRAALARRAGTGDPVLQAVEERWWRAIEGEDAVRAAPRWRGSPG